MEWLKPSKYRSKVSRNLRLFLVTTNLLIALFATLLLLGEIESTLLWPAVPVFFAAAVLWPISLILAFRSDRQSITSTLAWMRRSIALPYLLLALLLVRWNVPFRIAFAISKPAMERLAHQVIALPQVPTNFENRRVGLFYVGLIEKLPTGMRFRSGYGHPFDYNGFAYSASPLPDESDGYHYIHFRDNWYLCLGG